MKSIFLPRLLIRLFVILLCFSCSHNDDQEPITTNNINDFVWKGLNSWYYWQDDVSALEDAVATQNSYVNLIKSYEDPSQFFYSLLNDYPNTDRFSFIIEDYDQLLSAFQGTSASFGFELGLARVSNQSNEIVGYVKYVLPNSLAESEGIQRGDFFTKVNGTTLTIDNYVDLLYGSNNFEIELAAFNGNDFTPNGIFKNVTQEVLTENPVYYKNVYGNAGNKAGYLVYNGFIYTFNEALNEAFGYFQNENINHLILDLRYNGGGSVETASYLASMIKASSSETVFASLQFNSKHQEENTTYNFTDSFKIYDSNGEEGGEGAISSLNLQSLTVLTTYSTASASELLINGLKPFVPVTIIGTTTRGKDVGSITLFDSPIYDFISKKEANKEHKWAMQPIVFKSYNANNESNYSEGFTPDIEINELQYIDGFVNLGDTNETLLGAALDAYGIDRSATDFQPKHLENISVISNETLLNPWRQEMYIGNIQ